MGNPIYGVYIENAKVLHAQDSAKVCSLQSYIVRLLLQTMSDQVAALHTELLHSQQTLDVSMMI